MSYKVLGYVKTAEVFKTIPEWIEVAEVILAFQKKGFDTRAGDFRCLEMLNCPKEEFEAFRTVVMENFGYLMFDVDRFPMVTPKQFF